MGVLERPLDGQCRYVHLGNELLHYSRGSASSLCCLSWAASELRVIFMNFKWLKKNGVEICFLVKRHPHNILDFTSCPINPQIFTGGPFTGKVC